MDKILITGGCSFSETVSHMKHTWPNHLAKELEKTHVAIHTGMGSQGNGLISRRILYNVMKELEKNDPKDILVGVMWSGPSRHDFYHKKPIAFEKVAPWIENPTKFVPDSPGAWALVFHSWENDYSRTFYKNYYDFIGSLIYTLEHILRLQWFLKYNKINYFMTTFMEEVLPKIIYEHPDLSYLASQIDKNHFLPVTGEYEWCKDNMPNAFPYVGDKHPGIEQHIAFTKQVIIPFLEKKKYI